MHMWVIGCMCVFVYEILPICPMINLLINFRYALLSPSHLSYTKIIFTTESMSTNVHTKINSKATD